MRVTDGLSRQPWFTGPSGGGKSTTVGLIERFYDVTSGELNYLGVDVRSLNVSWYRTQLSYVGQEPTLFNMTIAENIAFGAEGVSRADIEEAARQVTRPHIVSTAFSLNCNSNSSLQHRRTPTTLSLSFHRATTPQSALLKATLVCREDRSKGTK